MKNRFLNISIGVTLMLFGIGFVIRSVAPANAAPTPDQFVDEGTGKNGKYMMQVFTFTNSEVRRAMIWDTETGKSIMYYESGNSWTTDNPQLPSNPMGE